LLAQRRRSSAARPGVSEPRRTRSDIVHHPCIAGNVAAMAADASPGAFDNADPCRGQSCSDTPTGDLYAELSGSRGYNIASWTKCLSTTMPSGRMMGSRRDNPLDDPPITPFCHQLDSTGVPAVPSPPAAHR
jgi:hypothetical protein